MEQHQNWLRIVLCLDFVGLPALKRILHDEIGAPEDGKKLYIYLYQFKSSFEQEEISADQREKILPISKITDTDKFDITLYSLIINNIIKCNKLKIQTNRKFIYGLKNFRNRIYHMGDKKMEEADFEREWSLVIRFFHCYNKFNTKSVTSLKTDSLISSKYMERIIFIFIQGNLLFFMSTSGVETRSFGWLFNFELTLILSPLTSNTNLSLFCLVWLQVRKALAPWFEGDIKYHRHCELYFTRITLISFYF